MGRTSGHRTLSFRVKVACVITHHGKRRQREKATFTLDFKSGAEDVLAPFLFPIMVTTQTMNLPTSFSEYTRGHMFLSIDEIR